MADFKQLSPAANTSNTFQTLIQAKCKRLKHLLENLAQLDEHRINMWEVAGFDPCWTTLQVCNDRGRNCCLCDYISLSLSFLLG